MDWRQVAFLAGCGCFVMVVVGKVCSKAPGEHPAPAVSRAVVTIPRPAPGEQAIVKTADGSGSACAFLYAQKQRESGYASCAKVPRVTQHALADKQLVLVTNIEGKTARVVAIGGEWNMWVFYMSPDDLAPIVGMQQPLPASFDKADLTSECPLIPKRSATVESFREVCEQTLARKYKSKVGYSGDGPKQTTRCGDMQWLFGTWTFDSKNDTTGHIERAYQCDYSAERDAIRVIETDRALLP